MWRWSHLSSAYIHSLCHARGGRPPLTMPRLRPELLKTAPFGPSDIESARARTHGEFCKVLAQRGMCQLEDNGMRETMARFCRGACNGVKALPQATLEHHQEWSQLSLFDYRQYDAAQCTAAETRKLLLSRQRRCANLEDLSRIRDRGWAIRRGFVPPEELQRMAEGVARIQEPARSMCGAGGYQPQPCFLQDRWEQQYPIFARALRDMLQGWISSGFHEEASLGWPLEVMGGEFITISPWRRPQTATCIFRALLGASAMRSDRQRSACVAKQCTPLRAHTMKQNECLMRCEWLSVTRLPLHVVRKTVAAPDCQAPHIRKLRWLAGYSFAEGPDEPSGAWGEAPDVGEMHGWLRLALNDTSVFSGYHGWHQDGPGTVGRFHKVFVMVEKNRSTDRLVGRSSALTNLMAVDAAARYQHNCALASVDDWDMERLDCRPHLLPGDILFFREDVYHATQDSFLDRISLIIDVWRAPLRTTPAVFIEKGSSAGVANRENELDAHQLELHRDDTKIFGERGGGAGDGRRLSERRVNRRRTMRSRGRSVSDQP